MGRYLIHRLLWMAPSLLLLLIFSVGLMQALPGSPWDDEYRVQPALKRQLQEDYGWSGGAWQATGFFLQNILTGRLGPSLQNPQVDASDLIASAWSLTMQFAVPALGLSLVVSLLLAVALVDSSWLGGWRTLSHFILSIPSVVLFPVILLACALMRFLPLVYDGSLVSMILPVLFMALKPIVHLTNILLKSCADLLAADFVRTARAFGFSASRIKGQWLLKNAIIPYVVYLPPLMVNILSGSLFLEIIFNIQGMGLLFINSLLDRDYFVLLGLILYFGLALSLIQLLADLLSRTIDPRMRTP